MAVPAMPEVLELAVLPAITLSRARLTKFLFTILLAVICAVSLAGDHRRFR